MDSLHDLFLTSLPDFAAVDDGGPPLNEQMIVQAEERLGYKLPSSYVAVLRQQNGGLLRRCHFRPRAPRADSLSEFWVHSFYGIGGEEGIDAPGPAFSPSYASMCISEYLIEMWNSPNVGVVIFWGGHAGYLLDYSHCGRTGEPEVIYVYAECSPKTEVFFVAPTFGEFCEGLSEYRTDGTKVWD